ncbi:hypothetical protein ACFQ2M_19930 [Kitasatospora saccharophila]|uniref:hypothetical protein n=1 Tax=Kitasatospora saccharophila TaxID=407973 RepID=UPI003625781A
MLATHLYSTPLVALRELVQNAHDSHTRRKLEDPEGPTGRSSGSPATRRRGRWRSRTTGRG